MGDVWNAIKGVKEEVDDILQMPAVRFAIAAAVGIHTGYTAFPALIKAELSRMVAIAAASAIGAAAAADSYYKFSSNAISNVINGSLRSSGSQTDGGRSAKTPASPSTPYTNKNGSQHVSSYPTTGLGYYGLEAGQPNQSGNYNSEEAVWKLMNAVNAAGGFENKKDRNNKNPTLIGAGGSLIGFGSRLASSSPNVYVKFGGVLFGALGVFIGGSGAGWWPLFPYDWVADVEKETYSDLTPIQGDL